MKFFVDLILKSKILEISVAICITLLAVSFGIAIIYQGKHGCFGDVMRNGIEIIREVKE